MAHRVATKAGPATLQEPVFGILKDGHPPAADPALTAANTRTAVNRVVSKLVVSNPYIDPF